MIKKKRAFYIKYKCSKGKNACPFSTIMSFPVKKIVSFQD